MNTIETYKRVRPDIDLSLFRALEERDDNALEHFYRLINKVETNSELTDMVKPLVALYLDEPNPMSWREQSEALGQETTDAEERPRCYFSHMAIMHRLDLRIGIVNVNGDPIPLAEQFLANGVRSSM